MAYADSEAGTGTLALQGVWIHDPLDPQETVEQYLYGGAARTARISPAQAGTRYAGRMYPVFDYGEFQDDDLQVSIVVPHGETWATEVADLEAFAQSRRTLCVRDNRGRLLFGTITGFTENDRRDGTAFGFTVVRTEFDESVV